MAKKILFNEDAKKALKIGIDTVAHAVSITIGPRGRNAIFDTGYGVPTVTNDGVSIAKEITLPDGFENMGAEIIKEVAIKTNEEAGDGTSTSVVLAHSIIEGGMKQIAMGANGVLMRQGIEDATQSVIRELQKMAKPIKSDTDIRNIATISAESKELGSIIADMIKKIGTEGIVTVEESQSFGVTSSIVSGLSFEKGYISPYMITNTERMEAEMKDPYILITDKKVSHIKEILPLIEKVIAVGKKEMVIIAEDIDGDALNTFVVNKLRGTFSVLGIKAPGYADRKRDQLIDIAIMTGGSVLTDEIGLGFENVEIEHLGRAGRVVCKKEHTVIVSGRGTKKAIDERAQQIRTLMQSAQKFDKAALARRLAKLTGGIGVIHVGATTETEMKYLKLKIEDAVNATKAAIAEGVVPGGGIALVRAGGRVSKSAANKNREYSVGFELVLQALVAPLRHIVNNGGSVDGAVVIAKVQEASQSKTPGIFGYDAYKEQYVPDMFSAGIIDPLKVTRTALQNAASVAGVFLTTEVAIVPIPEKAKEE